MIRHTAWGSLLSFLLLALLGCSASKDSKVTGKVSYKGEVVSGGTLTLVPSTGDSKKTAINPDGTYNVSLPPGTYKVVIETTTIQKMAMPVGGSQGPPKGAVVPPGAKVVDVPAMNPEQMPKFVEIPQKYGKKKRQRR